MALGTRGATRVALSLIAIAITAITGFGLWKLHSASGLRSTAQQETCKAALAVEWKEVRSSQPSVGATVDVAISRLKAKLEAGDHGNTYEARSLAAGPEAQRIADRCRAKCFLWAGNVGTSSERDLLQDFRSCLDTEGSRVEAVADAKPSVADAGAALASTVTAVPAAGAAKRARGSTPASPRQPRPDLVGREDHRAVRLPTWLVQSEEAPSPSGVGRRLVLTPPDSNASATGLLELRKTSDGRNVAGFPRCRLLTGAANGTVQCQIVDPKRAPAFKAGDELTQAASNEAP